MLDADAWQAAHGAQHGAAKLQAMRGLKPVALLTAPVAPRAAARQLLG